MLRCALDHSFFDNSAFTAWRQGEPITDWNPYFKWCREWGNHPSFQWAIIPDVIDGTEAENDDLIQQWDRSMWNPVYVEGVPVWHLHESLDRLERLVRRFKRVALGSSGDFSQPGNRKWRERMDDAFKVIAPNGHPLAKIHGLRMMSPYLVERYPFASVDSTNIAQNSSLLSEKPLNALQQMVLMSDRIESSLPPSEYRKMDEQFLLF